MTEATKNNPAPLDAYETAKPNEPIWTVQGGDPLSSSLLRIWALFARIQAQRIPQQGLEYVFEEIRKAANENPPKNDKEIDELLVRALETEQISWTMDEYRKGIVSEEQTTAVRFNEFDRLDIHDLRRRTVTLISAFFSDLNDHCEELAKHEWLSQDLKRKILRAIADLREIMNEVDIKRK